mgnify:CR=1 FL=1
MIEANNTELTVKEQCALLGISRSAYYYKKKPMSKKNKTILDRIDEIYTKWPSFGARRIVVMLAIVYSISVGRRKVGTMMKTLGLEAIRPKKFLSQPDKQHKIYPYRLRGMKIDRPNKVWCADITYIRLNNGKFVYLVAIGSGRRRIRSRRGLLRPACRTQRRQGSHPPGKKGQRDVRQAPARSKRVGI